VRTEYLVRDDTAGRMAAAATTYRLTRPAFLGAVALELVTAALLAAGGAVGWAVVVVLIAVALPASMIFRRSTLATAMRARGFAPGTTMSVDWQPEQFVVTTDGAHGTYRYDAVRHAKPVGEAVVIRLGAARVLIVLPQQLAPPSVHRALGVTHPAKSRTAAP
jgi:hypothetical protein